ncbi:MAG: hypothetical protein RJA47_1018 [Actinomycetota bacterium]|jgi:pimeloyl-ACP methyl ester carboxylesterase
MQLRKVAALILPVIALTACGGGNSAPDTTVPGVDSTLPDVERPITWKPCVTGFADGDECGTIKVPFDYSDPSIGEFTLHLRRHPAQEPSERIGSLLVNPGGPGFGGIFLAEQAGSYFSSDLTDRFDIVAWDPRGTGESTPYVDCIDDYDEYFEYDITPSTPEDKQVGVDLAKKFGEECQKRSGTILPYISTNNTVRDMETIRRALGEEKISYLGFSYGSELGATWATMFPHTVRAAVLDGAADPTADAIQGGLQQAAGFEKELNTFLDECSADPTCAFHNNGKADEAFDALAKKIDAKPVVVSPDRTPVNLSVFYTGVSEAMYSSSMWGELERALAALQEGDGEGVLSLNDQYYQRKSDGTYGNELEAFNAISCLDDPGPKSVEESDKWIPEFMKVAPRLGPSFSSGYGCVFWPATPDHRIAITGKDAGPILVVGTTGDSATPLASSRKMAETLEDGRLIVNNAQRHTGYGSNDCVTSAVDDYLITTKISFREKAC